MRIHARALIILPAFLLVTALCYAEGTRTWEQSKFEELEKGTADGVAIRSDGGLELAPAFKAIATMPSPYVWAIAADRDGNLLAATGLRRACIELRRRGSPPPFSSRRNFKYRPLP